MRRRISRKKLGKVQSGAINATAAVGLYSAGARRQIGEIVRALHLIYWRRSNIRCRNGPVGGVKNFRGFCTRLICDLTFPEPKIGSSLGAIDSCSRKVVAPAAKPPSTTLPAKMAEVDVAELIAPVSEDRPAGDPDAYSHRLHDQFRELRREEDADDYDDVTRPEVLKQADWSGIVNLAVNALQHESKDLRIVGHLIEGLARTEGINGIADGLDLLKTLLEQCWDNLNPPLDDGPEARLAPLANLLDDEDRGVLFPRTVRRVPLLSNNQGQLTAVDWLQWQQSKIADDQARLSRILTAATGEDVRHAADQAQRAHQTARDIAKLLDDRLGGEATALLNLQKALEQCQRLLGAELARRPDATAQPEPPAAETATPEATAASAAPVRSNPTDVSDIVARRQEIYRQLSAAADMLEQIEPNSPAPFLVRRAVQLGQLPFPQLMEAIVREQAVLDELKRQIGGTQDSASAT
ncbi:type VI secretion system protein TssA [Blastopirellula marina]|uniref:Type VI secretion system protein TssA n=2 Tax=Blastopirellula marina TaxID=124 RepID=A0A2S8G6C9_9BACT|nr:type VI secretion system protein TssA [Blastopirellula marina]PTL45400.1 type VI secretion system protein TssA [Blastopirellula marina]